MIWFEIKKIFSKTINKVALLVLLVILFISGFFTISSVEFVDEDGDTTSGIAAAHQLANMKKQWNGFVTEELLQRMIEENNKINASEEYQSKDNAENNKAYARKQGFSDIRDMVSRAFSGFQDYNYYLADDVSTAEVGQLYKKRILQLQKWLNAEDVKSNFSQEEKQFLLAQYEKLKTPLYYEDSDGWSSLIEYLPMVIMLFVLISAFLVSGIFSSEFQLKADAIFFSTKTGRHEAVRSKVFAGFLIVTALYWAITLLFSLVILGVLGMGGGSCFIQTGIGGWKSFYTITFFQEYLLTILGGYLGSLFILTLSMFISAKFRSTVLAVTVPFAILFIPSFLSGKQVLSKVLGLLPDQLLQLNMAVKYFNLYQINGKVIGAVPILITVYLLFYIILVPALYQVYRKAEVK
ncbi:MAG: ABC transporter permease [Velocimicrobium sp.]